MPRRPKGLQQQWLDLVRRLSSCFTDVVSWCTILPSTSKATVCVRRVIRARVGS